MKTTTLRNSIFLFCALFTLHTQAQVTIGSTQPPVTGALLDLKQEIDGTSNRGLSMPRVQLQDVAKLKMSATGTEYADKVAHTGLAVYHVSGNPLPQCAPIPDGLYVWDGAKWNGISPKVEITPASLDVGTKTTFDLPSGRDARPLTAQSFTATWSPANPLTYGNTPHDSFGGVSFSGANVLPVSPLAASPVAFSLLPDAMAAADITANPFRSKESTLKFDAVNECGTITTKSIIVNQTNKILIIDGSSTPPTIEATVNGVETNMLQSNTKWQLASMEPSDASSVFSGIKIDGAALAIGAATDWEQNNNTGRGTANNLSYTITIGATKSRYNKLIFSDTENPKRFDDVTLSVMQCSGINPKMSEWAAMAGFAGVAEPKISDADDIAKGINIPNTTTGIAWHRDQSGLIFLSSSFHPTEITSNAQRWMITNLAAEYFTADNDRTGDDKLVLQGFNTSPSGVSNNRNPLWAYPSNTPKPIPNQAQMTPTDPTNYNNNPRLGRLYNWAAATNSRGGISTGLESIIDGENIVIPRPKIQGICPKGWHLPNDVEWTALEREINSNTITYSSQATNANGTITAGITDNRGNLHGKAMRESCEPYNDATHRGSSTTIGTTKRPGFEVLLGGYANGGSAYGYATNTYLWSSSGDATNSAWTRNLSYGISGVNRSTTNRSNLFSVRCKKD